MKLNDLLYKLVGFDGFCITLYSQQDRRTVYRGPCSGRVMELFGKQKVVAWQPENNAFTVWIKKG